MTECEEMIRQELMGVAADLASARDRLRRLRAQLPVSPREDLIHLDEAEMDFPTQARASLDCVVEDRLTPAVEILQETARWPEETL
jgi:hypothetical protein